MTSLDLTLTFGGPALVLLAATLGWLATTRLHGVLAWTIGLFAIVLTPAGIYGVGLRYRQPPPPTQQPLAPGLDYERHIVEGPAVVHIVRIDLARPDIVPVTTLPAEGTAVPAQRVLDFARETGAAVAMNTAFFRPFYSNSPFDYYPHSGEPTEPFGLTMTDGEEFGANRYHRGTIYFSEDAVSLDPFDAARWAVTGRTVLVRDGQAQDGDAQAIAPRSAIAFDGTRVWFVVVDGRQPGYSEGISLAALGRVLAELGAQWAVEMDGGGSSTLVATTGTRPRSLNCPIHTRLPCRARAVAAQVGMKIVDPQPR